MSRRGLIAQCLDRWVIKWVMDLFVLRTGDASNIKWLNKYVWQYPLDAWIIREVVSEYKLEIIIEIGTFRGGLTFFLACLCNLLSYGRIISIDIEPVETIGHPRISYIQDSLVGQVLIGRIEEELCEFNPNRVLIVLDSDHSMKHLLSKLRVYSRFVPVSSYIHMQYGIIINCLDSKREDLGQR